MPELLQPQQGFDAGGVAKNLQALALRVDLHPNIQQYEQLKLEAVEADADTRSYWMDGAEMDCGPEESLLAAY